MLFPHRHPRLYRHPNVETGQQTHHLRTDEGRNIGIEIRDSEKRGSRIGPPPDLPHGEEDSVPSNDKGISLSLNGS